MHHVIELVPSHRKREREGWKGVETMKDNCGMGRHDVATDSHMTCASKKAALSVQLMSMQVSLERESELN